MILILCPFQESFQNLKYWISEVEGYNTGSDLCKILIGNKCHQNDKREVDYSLAKVWWWS